jgi:enoyl-CoA hydratase
VANVAELIEQLSLEAVEAQVEENLLTITVSRPHAMNALSPLVISELRSVVSLLREHAGQGEPEDWSVRGVMLTGAGEKAFVAGADISHLNAMNPQEAQAYAKQADELTLWLESLPVPVIAAVNGYALGGGCELAMSCDVIYASANASFGQPEVGLGIIPGFGGCVRLQQYVGVAHARELIFTGKRIGAERAERIGLVAHVSESVAELREEALKFLTLTSQQSPSAVAWAKSVMRQSRSLSTRAGLELEREAFGQRFGTRDMVEGTSAFLEKRQPQFPAK